MYFGPLGLKCVVSSICSYLTMYNKKIIESNVMIQHPLSFHCGFFVLVLYLQWMKSISLQAYYNLFTTVNLIDNDRNVCSFIIKFTENVWINDLLFSTREEHNFMYPSFSAPEETDLLGYLFGATVGISTQTDLIRSRRLPK